jgi:hypothetical protein
MTLAFICDSLLWISATCSQSREEGIYLWWDSPAISQGLPRCDGTGNFARHLGSRGSNFTIRDQASLLANGTVAQHYGTSWYSSRQISGTTALLVKSPNVRLSMIYDHNDEQCSTNCQLPRTIFAKSCTSQNQAMPDREPDACALP